ncbi:MAG TPA: dockerin type I domain-containing protein [Pirellulales bacterium]|nr:dockerin type I domain-containing protein [Pirellulales bacterium]
MRFLSVSIFAAALLFLVCAGPARAVYDIAPRLVTLSSGQQSLATFGYDDAGDNSFNPVYLTVNPLRVFSYYFGDYQDPYFDEDPGTHGLATTSGYTPSNLPQGSWMSFDVMSSLQYWSGDGPVSFGNVPAGETLQMYLPGSLPGQKLGSVTIGTGTGFQPGFPLQNVDAYGGMHKHMWTELQAGTNSTPADGIYLFEMRDKLLESDAQTPYPGVADSLPFFVMFDNNESLSVFQQAQTWVTDNLVPFGDFNRDGQVDAADIPAMMNALTNLSAYQANNNLTNFELMAFGDINSDGKINNGDLQGLLSLFTSGENVLVPEPASVVLLATGVIMLMLVRTAKVSPVGRSMKLLVVRGSNAL